MKTDIKKPRKWGALILFTSISTLLCCALPILLVSLGMGAVVASMASNIPWLITLSMHKGWVFAGSGFLLLLGGWALYRPGITCPTNPEYAKLCDTAQKWNRRFYWSSLVILCIGAFSAFVLPLMQ